MQCYSNLLCSDVHHVIQKKRPEKLSKIILLHDNDHPHTANLMKATLAEMDCAEILAILARIFFS
jgi:hypothetical protein